MTGSSLGAQLVMTPAELAIVAAILKRHIPGRTVWAFGSRVKGTTKKFADLDLAMLGDTPLPFTTRASLVDAFTESDLPYKIDVVDWALTSASIRSQIEASYIPLQNVHASSPSNAATRAGQSEYCA